MVAQLIKAVLSYLTNALCRALSRELQQLVSKTAPSELPFLVSYLFIVPSHTVPGVTNRIWNKLCYITSELVIKDCVASVLAALSLESLALAKDSCQISRSLIAEGSLQFLPRINPFSSLSSLLKINNIHILNVRSVGFEIQRSQMQQSMLDFINIHKHLRSLCVKSVCENKRQV